MPRTTALCPPKVQGAMFRLVGRANNKLLLKTVKIRKMSGVVYKSDSATFSVSSFGPLRYI